MSLITIPNTFSNGQTADGTQVTANFNTIANDYNGNITDQNIANSGITTYGKVSGSALSGLGSIAAGAGIIPAGNVAPSLYFPVGSVYINALVSTNPNTLLGYGTWTSLGAGRVLVGVDTNDSDFNAVGKTGGEKTHTLTQSELPNVKLNVGKFPYQLGNDDNGYGTASGNGVTFAGQDTATNTWKTSALGSGTAHNTLPPYITAYMWYRSA